MPTFTPLTTVPGLAAWQFAYSIDDGYCAGKILRATVTQKVEVPNADSTGITVLKCVIAVIDDQNTVQTDAAGDPMDKVYVMPKTLYPAVGETVQVANEAADLVADCIVEVCNRLAVQASIAAMQIPSG